MPSRRHLRPCARPRGPGAPGGNTRVLTRIAAVGPGGWVLMEETSPGYPAALALAAYVQPRDQANLFPRIYTCGRCRSTVSPMGPDHQRL